MPDGKIVKKFKYRKHDADVTIPVRIVEISDTVEQSRAPHRGKGSKPRTTVECTFRIYFEECGLKGLGNKEIGHKDFYENTDINVILQMIIGHLDDKYEIKWEERFMVTVEEPYTSEPFSAGLEVAWRYIYVAKLPDGRWVHRDSIYGGYKIRDGLPKTGKIARSGDRPHLQAMIEATDENEEALKSLKERLADVRDKLMEFLKPDNIEENLATVAEMLLPAPDGEKK
jgi:hypothetical protein